MEVEEDKPTIVVRASLGTLAVLGAASVRMDSRPTTAYLLQYSPYGCLAGCRFCSQSLTSRSSLDFLSRIRWPTVSLKRLLELWRSGGGRSFSRLCLQTIVKPFFHVEATMILEMFRSVDDETPVSVASTPVSTGVLARWRSLGVDRLGVGLDAATPAVFSHALKPYSWRRYMEFIREAVAVYGRGKVYVHLIAGLGEKPVEFVRTMETLYNIGARVALFRYTPLPGTARFPGVDVETYRILQIARALLDKGYSPWSYISETPDGGLRLEECLPLNPLEAFLTSGCPGCNRPFYNEGPRGPIYNYPDPRLLARDARLVARQLRAVSNPRLWGCIGEWLSRLSACQSCSRR